MSFDRCFILRGCVFVLVGVGCGDDLAGPDATAVADASLVSDATVSVDAVVDGTNPVRSTACDDKLAGTLFCDGFENPGLEPWGQAVSNGSLAASANPVFRGSSSVHAKMDASEGTASAELTLGTVLESNTFFFRAYYYLPSVSFSYLQILKFLEAGGAYGGVSVAVIGGATPFLQVLSETQAGSDSFPLDEWFCLQLNVAVDPLNGSAELFVNEATVARIDGVRTRPETFGYSFLGVGVEFADGAQASTSVYVDEVVLDTAPVPCESNAR